MHRSWLTYLILFALALAVYWNSFPGTFHFDDYPRLLENPRVSGPSFDYSMFLQQYGGRPLTLLTFHWNQRLFGPDPLAFHLVSVFLHGVAVVLFFAFLRRIAVARWTALLAAVIFAIHPLQSQAVNYIWSRSMLLMSCFAFLSLLFYRRHPLWALACLQLAIWSRAEAVVLVLPLIWLTSRHWWKPALLAAVNLSAILFFLIRHQPLETAFSHSQPLEYWLAQGKVTLIYVSKMLVPAGLSVEHPAVNISAGSGLLWWLFLASILFLLWQLRSRQPLILLGSVWILLWLAPAQLVPNADMLNESRIYLALAGFALISSTLLKTLVLRWNKTGLTLLFTCLVIGCLGTIERNRVWADDLLLWQEAARAAPAKPRARYNLGIALLKEGQARKAEIQFLESLQLDPEDDMTLAALGYCAELKEREDEARNLYVKALKLNSHNEYALQSLRRLEGTQF